MLAPTAGTLREGHRISPLYVSPFLAAASMAVIRAVYFNSLKPQHQLVPGA
jgi:hypothetical protein